MLLATSRFCARPVTFYNNFDKYNGREWPEGDIVLSNVLQSMDNRTIVRGLHGISRRSEVFTANLRWFTFSGSARRVVLNFPTLSKDIQRESDRTKTRWNRGAHTNCVTVRIFLNLEEMYGNTEKVHLS